MNFLKISGLVLGTGTVVGGTGVGVYYGVSKSSMQEDSNNFGNEKSRLKVYLVFEKKSGTGNNTNYEIKLLTPEEYDFEIKKFDKDISDDTKKYQQTNKIIEISNKADLIEIKNKINSIFSIQGTFQEIKAKISEKVTEIKALFNNEIYESLENKFQNSNI